jgi:hypothetical protein
VSASDLLAPGERCLAAGKGLHAKPKPGVVQATLGKRYMVLLDGETEAQPFGLKKVKRLGKPAKKVAPGTGETEGWIATIRDQRPPTRLHIPDANVPTVEPGTPTVLRSGQPDRPVIQLQADSLAAFGIWEHRPQPKPKKPSRSAAYLQHVRQHDCCNCGAFGPSDPDHVGPRGVGQKTSDYNCIPLCRACHRHRTDKNVLPLPFIGLPGGGGTDLNVRTERIVLTAQVQMLREWAEKLEKETP